MKHKKEKKIKIKDKFFHINEVAAMLNVPDRTVRLWVEQGQLQVVSGLVSGLSLRNCRLIKQDKAFIF